MSWLLSPKTGENGSDRKTWHLYCPVLEILLQVRWKKVHVVYHDHEGLYLESFLISVSEHMLYLHVFCVGTHIKLFFQILKFNIPHWKKTITHFVYRTLTGNCGPATAATAGLGHNVTLLNVKVTTTRSHPYNGSGCRC